jgi:hypothetical protein
MEVSGQFHAPAAVPLQGKSPWYELLVVKHKSVVRAIYIMLGEVLCGITASKWIVASHLYN